MKRIFLMSTVLLVGSMAGFAQKTTATKGEVSTFKADFPFESAGDFGDGMAAAQVTATTPATATEEEKTTPLWGYIDGAGKWVIKPSFARARGFHEGIAPAAILEKGGSKEIIDPYQGKMFVTTDDSIWWGLVDRTGNWVAPAKFEELGDFAEGMAPCKVKQLWGYIDKTGTMAVKEQFMEARGFHEGLAAVKMEIPKLRSADRLWGYINKSGAFAIQPQFEEAGDFAGGKAVVKSGEGTCIIDKNGTASGALPADVEALAAATGPFPAPVKGPNGKWGYADAKGKVVIRHQFDEARAFAGGWGCVGMNDPEGHMRYGFVNKTGAFLRLTP